MFHRVVSSLLVAVVALICPASVPHAQDLPHDWSRGFGAADHQLGRAIVFGAGGNVIVAGEFLGTIDLGGGQMTSAGGYDIYLAALDPAGNHIWSQRFGDTENQYVIRLDVTHTGDILMVGHFANRVDFGDGLHISAGGIDAYAAKFSPGGACIWSRSFGDASDSYGAGISVGNGGMVYLIGYFTGAIDLGGGPLISAGDTDVWLAELDGSSGAHLWSKRFGDADKQIGWAIDATDAGTFAITGHARGTIDFGGGPLTSAGDYDQFVARFTSGGGLIWNRLMGDALPQTGLGVSISDANYMVTSLGQFQGTIDLGGGPLTSAGLYDINMARYTGTGGHIWSDRHGGTLNDYPRALAVTWGGDVALAGFFEGTSDFGGGPLSSAGEYDVFVSTYDATGAHLTSQRAGDATGQNAQGAAFDMDGNLAVVGSFAGTVDFGGEPLSSAGDYDAFLVKFGGGSPAPGPATPARAGADPFALRVQPSPATPGAMLTYTLPEAGRVRVFVFDAEGRCLRTLVDEVQDAGAHAVPWDATSSTTGGLPSGSVRFVQLEVGGRVSVTRALQLE